MRYFKDAPKYLLEELHGRIGGIMQPKATEDLLHALATVYPEGMALIVRLVVGNQTLFPAYHLRLALEIYENWRKRSGFDLCFQLADGTTAPFPRWIAIHCALLQWEDHATPMMLAVSHDVAVEFILRHLQHDDEKTLAILGHLRGVSTYSPALLERMLASPSMSKLIPEVFSACFDAFPVDSLHRCIVCADINQEMLFYRLSATNNPLHRTVHAELMERALSQELNLHHFRYIANMLRGHSRHDVLTLLDNASRSDENKWIWMAREIETARGERLIDEAGRLRY